VSYACADKFYINISKCTRNTVRIDKASLVLVRNPRTLDKLLRSLPTISVQGALELNSFSVLGAFAKVRKATVSFVMSVRPSVLIEQLGPPLDGFS